MSKIGLVAAAIALACCSCASGNSAFSGDGDQIVQHVSGSRVRTYRTLDDLRIASSAVLTGRTSSKSSVVETISGIPFSGVTFTIEKILGISNSLNLKSGDAIVIRVTGGDGTVNDDVAALQPDATYLLFLTEFRHLPDGPTNGQFVIVGADSGMFVDARDGRYTKQSKVDPDLPDTISQDESATVVIG